MIVSHHKLTAPQEARRTTGVLSFRSLQRLALHPNISGPLLASGTCRRITPLPKRAGQLVTCASPSDNSAAPPSPSPSLPGWLTFWAIWATAVVISQPSTIHKMAGQSLEQQQNRRYVPHTCIFKTTLATILLPPLKSAGVVGGAALQETILALGDVLIEKGMLMLTRFGSQSLLSKICIVLSAGLPFIVFFGAIYHKLTKTPIDVRSSFIIPLHSRSLDRLR